MKLKEFTTVEILALLLLDLIDLYEQEKNLYGTADRSGQLKRILELHSALRLARLKVWSEQLPDVCSEEEEQFEHTTNTHTHQAREAHAHDRTDE